MIKNSIVSTRIYRPLVADQYRCHHPGINLKCPRNASEDTALFITTVGECSRNPAKIPKCRLIQQVLPKHGQFRFLTHRPTGLPPRCASDEYKPAIQPEGGSTRSHAVLSCSKMLGPSPPKTQRPLMTRALTPFGNVCQSGSWLSIRVLCHICRYCTAAASTSEFPFPFPVFNQFKAVGSARSSYFAAQSNYDIRWNGARPPERAVPGSAERRFE